MVLTATEYTGYLNAYREVYTQLVLKYRNRLQQGIKSDEMLDDLFVYDTAIDMLENYDTSDLALGEASANIITPSEIQYVLDACNCIRVKYNISINFAAYLTAASEDEIPINALQAENGDYILTEDDLYILVE